MNASIVLLALAALSAPAQTNSTAPPVTNPPVRYAPVRYAAPVNPGLAQLARITNAIAAIDKQADALRLEKEQKLKRLNLQRAAKQITFGQCQKAVSEINEQHYAARLKSSEQRAALQLQEMDVRARYKLPEEKKAQRKTK